jgi:hypothetical protein
MTVSEHPTLSTFVHSIRGTTVIVLNTIYENALEVLTELNEGQPFTEVFETLIKTGPAGGQHAVLPDSTWYAFLTDYLTYYAREFSDF